nr:hypothetical protein [Peribacillus frigoritolerans]
MTNEQAIGTIFADEKVDHTDKSIPRADVAPFLPNLSQRKKRSIKHSRYSAAPSQSRRP